MNELIETLQGLISEGEKLAPQGGDALYYNGDMQPDYLSWRMQAIVAIEEVGATSKHILKDIENDSNGAYFFKDSANRILGSLRAALVIAQRKERSTSPSTQQEITNPIDPAKIFIVHGHDQVLLQQTARFLEKLDLKPIILFEQPGQSQTIIEKIEKHSNVRFAVILLTPDDVGKAAKDEKFQPRARQNVILELGYFLGKLGRPNVVALYYEALELPSDYHGVEYLKVDAEGAWKMKLAKELKEAGLAIDMNKAI